MTPEPYEFSERDNSQFQDLIRRLKIFSFVLMLFSVPFFYRFVDRVMTVDNYPIRQIENGQFQPLQLVATGVMFIALGLLARFPIDNLKKIIHTSEHDLTELFIGINDFKKFFAASAVVLSIISIIRLWSVISKILD